MNDYISREAGFEILQSRLDSISQMSYLNMDWHELDIMRNAIEDAINDIGKVPAADVQRIKHGYWEEVTDYGGWGDTHYRCSVCGEEWYLEDGKPKDNNMNFCPRCGAKMDAESDEPWQSE